MVHCYINTNTDKEWDNMITANNSPRRSIDDIIEISDDEEDGETTQEPILFITERLSPQQYKKKKNVLSDVTDLTNSDSSDKEN